MLTYYLATAPALTTLCKGFKENTSISWLWIDGISTHENYKNAIAQGFKEIFESNSTLNFVSLNDNGINDEGAKLLSAGLKKNHSITYLTLSNNNIADIGITALSEALLVNNTLTIFDVINNKIGNSEAAALAEVLKKNKTLKSLGLGENNIESDGAIAFSRALVINRTLDVLSLNHNKMHSGARALFESIRDNINIIILNINDNFIEKTSVDAIKKITDTNWAVRTAFFSAIEAGNLEIVQNVIKLGINLSCQENKRSNTPLHVAVIHKQLELVKILVAAMRSQGLALTTTNHFKKTALQYAEAQSPIYHALTDVPKDNANINKKESNVGEVTLSFLIPKKDLEKGEELGRGGFGIVYKGTWQYKTVAIKEIATVTTHAQQEFVHEMEMMAKLRYPHVVQLYGVCVDTKPNSLVMEYMSNGSLYEVLHSKNVLSEKMSDTITLDIAMGLTYLHNNQILHCDIKSMNILLDEHFNAKITDFGLAKVKIATSNNNNSLLVGTYAWMAPEILGSYSPSYSTKSDIYSYGMVVWEIVSRDIPFKAAGGDYQIIKNWVAKEGRQESIPLQTPPKLAHLIRHCWSQDPAKRPSGNQVISYLQNPTPSP